MGTNEYSQTMVATLFPDTQDRQHGIETTSRCRRSIYRGTTMIDITDTKRAAIELELAQARKRRDKGIEWLNENKPDWSGDRKDLNMAQCHNCILGQNFGDFRNIVDTAGSNELLTMQEAVALGFIEDEYDDDMNYPVLQQVWEEVL